MDEHLEGLLNQRNWALLTMQTGGLDAFADRYGFVARDDALRALALLMNHSVNEGQVDPDKSFVGQLSDNSFIIIVEAERASELCQRLAARIQQSTHFFYPAKEQMPAGERPQLDVCAGLDHF